MKRIYIASPLNAPTPEGIRENMLRAREYISTVEDSYEGVRAFAPHAWVPEMLDDLDATDRQLGLDFGIALLKTCDCIFVCGNKVSNGMRAEIKLAVMLNIPIYAFGTNPECISKQADGAVIMPSAAFAA